ncbi:Dyp-type peroxidase domain-containing protein [Staphylococcus aureus]
MIQACSNDSQVSFHAVHNLVRPFRDIVRYVGVVWFYLC